MNPASRFTDEFKAQVVEYFETKGKSLATTARKFNVSAKTISNWSRGVHFDRYRHNEHLELARAGARKIIGTLPPQGEADRKIALLESAVELLRLHPAAGDVLSKLFDLLYVNETTKLEAELRNGRDSAQPVIIEAAS